MKKLQSLSIIVGILLITQGVYTLVSDTPATQEVTEANTPQPANTDTTSTTKQNTTTPDQNDITADVPSIPAEPEIIPENTPSLSNDSKLPLQEDEHAAAQDQDSILHTIKSINDNDSKVQDLLNKDALHQIFNNIFYFKNFIVTNFKKEQIINLCMEFIDQIYPENSYVKKARLHSTHTPEQTTKEDDDESSPIPFDEYEKLDTKKDMLNSLENQSSRQEDDIAKDQLDQIDNNEPATEEITNEQPLDQSIQASGENQTLNNEQTNDQQNQEQSIQNQQPEQLAQDQQPEEQNQESVDTNADMSQDQSDQSQE